MSHTHGDPHAPASVAVTDPVCGMDVDPTKSAHHVEDGGRVHHFCSAHCRTKFEANPTQDVGAPSHGSAAAGGTTRRSDDTGG